MTIGGKHVWAFLAASVATVAFLVMPASSARARPGPWTWWGPPHGVARCAVPGGDVGFDQLPLARRTGRDLRARRGRSDVHVQSEMGRSAYRPTM